VVTTGFLAPYWLFVLGTMFIAVTILLPKGIVGTLADFDWKRRRKADSSPGGGRTVPSATPAE